MSRGNRLLPNWEDLKLGSMDKLMPIIWTYSYNRRSKRFIGRMAGVNIEQIFGRTFAGVTMEDLYPPKDFARHYARAHRVVETPEFYRGTGMVFRHLDHSGDGERIMLPVASNGAEGDGVLGATVYEFFLGDRVDPVPESDAWFTL